MRALAVIGVMLLGAAPAEVVVQPGENLAQVAKRSLGDERGAAELRALNALSTEEVTAGMKLKLPGPDRALAVSALSAARHAVNQSSPDGKNHGEAVARLTEAETLFRGARYGEAARTADAAWQLLSASAAEPTRFAVQVEADGKTLVNARSGQAVHVEAQGVTQAVYAGQTATVDKGHSPQLEGLEPGPDAPLIPPAPVSPQDASVFKFKAAPKGLGPLRVTWTPVAGAASYEVEVMPSIGPARPWIVAATRSEARLPLLAAGKYRWAVRSVGAAGVKSPPSVERTFELTEEDLKLDVKANTWK
jgi:hypothetical protein